jgi:hypothetical protein
LHRTSISRVHVPEKTTDDGTMKRGSVTLARELIRELADAGMGVRETARVMEMSPSHVAYYRAQLGIEVPPAKTADELLAALPADVQCAVRVYRAERSA